MTFAFGKFIQVLDANQGAHATEYLKFPSLLKDFKLKSGINVYFIYLFNKNNHFLRWKNSLQNYWKPRIYFYEEFRNNSSSTCLSRMVFWDISIKNLFRSWY